MSFSDAQDDAVIYYSETGGDVILAGTVIKGDCVGYSSGWKRAFATSASIVQMRAVASEDGVTGQSIKVYFGRCIVGGSRFSGATAGTAVYVAKGTAGQYTQTISGTSGDSTKQVGIALDAITCLLYPNNNVDSTA